MASILVAGPGAVALAGWIYVSLLPLQAANGYLMDARMRSRVKHLGSLRRFPGRSYVIGAPIAW